MNSFAFLGLCIVSTAASSVPKWEPTYNMSLSTIVMPCNFSGYTDAALAAKFGIVDFDCKPSRSASHTAAFAHSLRHTRLHVTFCRQRVEFQGAVGKHTAHGL